MWFKVSSQESGNPDVAAFADEHSLDAQRYFNLLCLVYGLDPDHNSGIVSKGMLPKGEPIVARRKLPRSTAPGHGCCCRISHYDFGRATPAATATAEPDAKSGTGGQWQSTGVGWKGQLRAREVAH